MTVAWLRRTNLVAKVETLWRTESIAEILPLRRMTGHLRPWICREAGGKRFSWPCGALRKSNAGVKRKLAILTLEGSKAIANVTRFRAMQVLANLRQAPIIRGE